MSIDHRLFDSIMNRSVREEFLIDRDNKDEQNIKPQIDFNINANIDWDKKCASLSIHFKLFFI